MTTTLPTETVNWQQGMSMPRLTDQEIHLWWLPLELSAAQQDVGVSLLNDIQHDRYQRRAETISGHPLLAERYLAGRYYMMHLLSGYAGIDPHALALGYSRLNKPFLINSDLHFNYTDTEGYGLFAIAKHIELGVDVEKLSREGDFTKIAAKKFSDNEIAAVTNADGSINKPLFLSVWTRKEAYGKALGKGLNYKMREVDLVNEEHKRIQLIAPDWTLEQIQLHADFIACLVYQGHRPFTLRGFKVSA